MGYETAIMEKQLQGRNGQQVRPMDGEQYNIQLFHQPSLIPQ
jgi:hypothetical protein